MEAHAGGGLQAAGREQSAIGGLTRESPSTMPHWPRQGKGHGVPPGRRFQVSRRRFAIQYDAKDGRKRPTASIAGIKKAARLASPFPGHFRSSSGVAAKASDAR